MSADAFDLRAMAAALSIGRQGLGRTSPNPSVGALIVRDGVVVGAARTADGGRPHAERLALEMAGEAARGATCYATLEPCSHVGRTLPCADALIAASVARVVVAASDPNPLVAGEGFARLRAAGIEVVANVRREEAERDLAGHLTRMRLGRPHVTLKLALSADGAIGRRREGQIAISGASSRTRVHLMRAQSDAIAVGIGTVLADDPELTCRLPGMAARSPHRVVIDSDARTPVNAALVRTLALAPATIVVGEGAPRERTDALRETGPDVAIVARNANGRVDLAAMLTHFHKVGIGRLLLEGGARLAEAFVEADLVDAIALVEAPVVLGGDRVRPFLRLPDADDREATGPASRLLVHRRERIGEDRWSHLERPIAPAASGAR